jgi:hypothetical protein
VQCWTRDKKEVGKRYKWKELSIDEKESFKWLKSYWVTNQVQRICPNTMLVNIGDREADIYELVFEAQKGDAKLLIRAERSRNRKTQDINLWDKMEKEEIKGYLEVLVPEKSSNRKGR